MWMTSAAREQTSILSSYNNGVAYHINRACDNIEAVSDHASVRSSLMATFSQYK